MKNKIGKIIFATKKIAGKTKVDKRKEQQKNGG
nr:MAG TPA: hypothetical protein [Caudoviricetes sp.]